MHPHTQPCPHTRSQHAPHAQEQEQTNKEERIELLHRKASRRMLNKDIADGFAAWQEMWSGKTYAMGKLREVANKLHAPELAIAFDLWSETHLEEKQQAEFMVSQRTHPDILNSSQVSIGRACQMVIDLLDLT